MSKVTITSFGTLGTTSVSIDERAIPSGDLMKVQIHYDPQVEQTGCELTFVNAEGRIERWSGVNVDDEFDFRLDVVQDATRYRVVSEGQEVRILVSTDGFPDAPGLPIFPKAAMVVDIVADGFGLQFNKYTQIATNPALRSVSHA